MNVLFGPGGVLDQEVRWMSLLHEYAAGVAKAMEEKRGR